MTSLVNQIYDNFSCPLCDHTTYPIHDHDLLIYQNIAQWLKDTIKIQLTSRVLNDYSVKLYNHNITTPDKLKFKLENHPNILLDYGFDDYDSKFIKEYFAMSASDKPVANPTPAAAVVPGYQQDRAILIRFYNSCNGPNWRDRKNWCSHSSLSHWHGITVDPKTERVTKIQLQSNNISGNDYAM